MVDRLFWLQRINEYWQSRSIVWLSGVRRVGKTTIAGMIDNAVYNNCDLPSVRRRLEDPESYFLSVKKDSSVIFDEVHRLENPSSLLKIAADEYPYIKVLATGSSTLEATGKFRDTLTGRKYVLKLLTVLWDECREAFNISDLDRRLFHGGLPEALLMETKDEAFYAEWADSFYARDIQELFNVRNRSGFLKLMQLIFRSSGSMMEITNLSKLSGLTRPTVMSYVEAMQIANMLFVLPPFHGSGRREITQRPKYYAFDTGFVCFMNGWNEIRETDRGLLWEHLALDMLRSHIGEHKIFYWRDKSGREIDFVLKRSSKEIDIIECKVNPDHFSTANMLTFREFYPSGNNYCYSPYISSPYAVTRAGLKVSFIGSARHLHDDKA